MCDCVDGQLSECPAVEDRYATRKASDWVKVAQSRIKTPHKPRDDSLPLDDSAKKTRHKLVK